MSVIDRYEEGERISLAELRSSSDQELRDLLVVVNGTICHIENQLSLARAHFQETGEYADPGWYSRASAARRIKGQLCQAIQAELGKRSTERKATNQRNSERTQVRSLVEAMDLVLTAEQKDLVLRTARGLRIHWEESGDNGKG